MLTRVFLPIGQKFEGIVVKTVSLPYRYRLLYHRTSIYLVGVAIVLGGIGGWLNTTFEIIIIMATFGLVSIKIHYTFTTQGIAINNVVYRNWSEFSDYKQEKRYLRLVAKAGQRDFKVLLPEPEQAEIEQMLVKLVRGSGASQPPTISKVKTTGPTSPKRVPMGRPAKKNF